MEDQSCTPSCSTHSPSCSTHSSSPPPSPSSFPFLSFPQPIVNLQTHSASFFSFLVHVSACLILLFQPIIISRLAAPSLRRLSLLLSVSDPCFTSLLYLVWCVRFSVDFSGGQLLFAKVLLCPHCRLYPPSRQETEIAKIFRVYYVARLTSTCKSLPIGRVKTKG